MRGGERRRAGAARRPEAAQPIRDSLGRSAAIRLFVHGLTRELLDEHAPRLPEVRRYGERALLLARPGDVVCLERRPDPAYLRDLRALGLGPRRGRVVVPRPIAGGASLAECLLADERALRRITEVCRDAPAVTLDSFRAAPIDRALARRLGRERGAPVRVTCTDVAAADRADEKAWVRRWAAGLGVPLATGEIVERGEPGTDEAADRLEPLRLAVARWLSATAAVVVRGSHGASGSATFVFGRDGRRNASTWREIARREVAGPYLVEVLHPVTVSPNLVYQVPANGRPPSLVAVSDQRLDARLAHRGNVHPSSARQLEAMTRTGRRLAAALQRLGYGGWLGFDLCERRLRDGRRDHFLAEVNPRANAGLYPLAALERLRARSGRGPAPRAAASATLPTSAPSYAELRRRLGTWFYDARAGRGALPYAVGGLTHGRIPVVALGASRAEARRCLTQARRLLAR